MKELKKIDVLSVGKVFAIFGLVLSALQMIFLKTFYVISPDVAMAYGFNMSDLTFGSMLFGVILVGVVYSLGGILGSLIYNFTVKYVGGIKFDLNEGKIKTVTKKKKK